MKLAIIMAGNEEGGLEKHVEDLVRLLVTDGHQVTWIAHPKYADRAADNARFAALDLTRSRNNPIILFKLWRTLRSLGPDIIHVHGGKALAMTAFLKAWLGIPLVATVHGLKKHNRGLAKADAVIAVSRHLAGSIDHPDVHVVYNGVCASPADAPHSSMLDSSGLKRPLWLAVGRLVEEKGFDVLITAFASVPGTLVIAGDGPLFDQLRAQIRRQQMQERVLLLGHRDDIAALMHDADALVISSRREGFSYVFAEALINRCPVVATSVPIANEVLPPELICPIEDPEALAGLMRNFTPQPETEAKLENFAKTRLSPDSMLRQTVGVYRAALARASR